MFSRRWTEVWFCADDDIRIYRDDSGDGGRLQRAGVLDYAEDPRDWNPYGAGGGRWGCSNNGSQDRIAIFVAALNLPDKSYMDGTIMPPLTIPVERVSSRQTAP